MKLTATQKLKLMLKGYNLNELKELEHLSEQEEQEENIDVEESTATLENTEENTTRKDGSVDSPDNVTQDNEQPNIKELYESLKNENSALKEQLKEIQQNNIKEPINNTNKKDDNDLLNDIVKDFY